MNSKNLPVIFFKKKKSSKSTVGNWALDLNGVDEYVFKSVPSNILTGNDTNFATGLGNWTSDGGATVTWGGSGNQVMVLALPSVGTSGAAKRTGLTELPFNTYGYVSFRIRCISGNPTTLYAGGSGWVSSLTSIIPTYSWTTVEFIKPRNNLLGSTIFYIGASSSNSNGSIYEIDDVILKKDWRLDLNGTELIKYSHNSSFESVNQQIISDINPSSAYWTLGSGWSLSDNKLIASSAPSGSTAFLNQAAHSTVESRKWVIANKWYAVAFTISNYSGSGTVNIQVGGSGSDIGNFSGNGRKYYWYYCTANSSIPIVFRSNNNFSGSIDALDVVEMIDWAGTGNHYNSLKSSADKYAGSYSLSIGSTGIGDSTSNCVTLPASQLQTLVAGTKYTLEGFVKLDASTVTYDSSILINGSMTGSLTGWATAAGISYGTDNAICTNYNASSFRNNANLILGKLYKITYTLTVTSGSIKLKCGTGNTGISRTTSGTYTEYQYCTTTTAMFFEGSLFNGVIDEVSCQPISNDLVFTAKLGGAIVTLNNPLVSTTYSKFVLNFLATSNEVNQPLKLYSNQASTVYVDNISLTQSYNFTIITKIKPINEALGWYLSTGASSGAAGISLYAAVTPTRWGWDIQPDSSAYSLFSSYQLKGTNSNFSTTTYQTNILVIDRLNNATLYTNNIAGAGLSTINKIGKLIQGNDLTLGAYSTKTSLINSYLSEVQLIRDYIPSASDLISLTSGSCKAGYAGGEVVAWYKWADGSSDTMMLRDYSAVGNNLTGVNVTTIDRIRKT